MKNTKSASTKQEECSACCGGGYCSMCSGWQWIVLGAVFLVNAYMAFLSLDKLIGVLLVIAGIVKLVKPGCGHCCCD